MARAALVAAYTLVELRRRRLLLAFVVIEVLLVAGIGLAPLVVAPGSTGEARVLFLLSALSGTLGPALLICAIALGMTIIRQDVDSGALAAILAKPVSRPGYAAGKLLAAIAMLAFVDGLFTAGGAILLALDGGGHVGILAVDLAATAANAALVMVVVMVLTVHWTGVLAALVGIGVLFVESIVATLHAAVQGATITSSFWRPAVEVAYGVLPRALEGDLARDILQTSLRLHPGTRPALPPGSLLAASGPGDVVAWAVWLAALCAALALAVRRRQV